tara:strand:- start:607 stop:822 length:216 start_codon:yes stop_codon:yes gene_type:complete
MYYVLISLLIMLIVLSIVTDSNKEPFIESLNVYKNCKKLIREKRRKIDKYSKDRIDDVKYKVRRFIRQSGL